MTSEEQRECTLLPPCCSLRHALAMWSPLRDPRDAVLVSCLGRIRLRCADGAKRTAACSIDDRGGHGEARAGRGSRAERVRYVVASHTSARPMRAGCPDAARAPANCALRGCRVTAPPRRVQANLEGRCHGDMVTWSARAPATTARMEPRSAVFGARALWRPLAMACAQCGRN